MTAPVASFTEFAAKAQEQVTAAVRSWADAVAAATDDLGTERPALVDPQVLTEKYFELAQQGLDKQRELVKALVAVSSEATKTVTGQAVAAAKVVAAQAAEAVKVTTAKS